MYDSANIAENIKTVSKQKEKALKDLLIKCNLGKNTISHMYHGRMIAADSLAIIADELNVSVDYLLGRTDEMEMNR